MYGNAEQQTPHKPGRKGKKLSSRPFMQHTARASSDIRMACMAVRPKVKSVAYPDDDANKHLSLLFVRARMAAPPAQPHQLNFRARPARDWRSHPSNAIELAGGECPPEVRPHAIHRTGTCKVDGALRGILGLHHEGPIRSPGQRREHRHTARRSVAEVRRTLMEPVLGHRHCRTLANNCVYGRLPSHLSRALC